MESVLPLFCREWNRRGWKVFKKKKSPFNPLLNWLAGYLPYHWGNFLSLKVKLLHASPWRRRREVTRRGKICCYCCFFLSLSPPCSFKGENWLNRVTWGAVWFLAPKPPSHCLQIQRLLQMACSISMWTEVTLFCLIQPIQSGHLGAFVFIKNILSKSPLGREGFYEISKCCSLQSWQLLFCFFAGSEPGKVTFLC